jgi:hypothetical protein
MKTKMFKNNRFVLLGLLVLIVGAVVFTHYSREHLTVNEDNSKNWDKPELASQFGPTPDHEVMAAVKKRVSKLEDDIRDIKSKMVG